MNTPYLETERLILRPWKQDDLLPFSQMVADPLVMEYFPSTLSSSEAEAFIETLKARFENNGFSFLATELKSNHEFIGFIGLNVPC
jgi:RimJ/RimL family protein N-acetyltransferase